jgi:DnaJ-class molecular chaperone
MSERECGRCEGRGVLIHRHAMVLCPACKGRGRISLHTGFVPKADESSGLANACDQDEGA